MSILKDCAKVSLLFVAGLTSILNCHALEVGVSPYGADDEVGALNAVTDSDRALLFSKISSGRVYDLSVELFQGMPGPDADNSGVPAYNYFFPWFYPANNASIDRFFEGEVLDGIGSIDDAVIMSLHHGTQIDSFAHVSYKGKMYNNFSVAENMGLKGLTRNGVENIPPIVVRAVMLDIAALKGVDVLPSQYVITPEDLSAAVERQKISLSGDFAVLIRTGQMRYWPDTEKYYTPAAGISVDSAKWLVEKGAVLLGGDNRSVEREPLVGESVHLYALVEAGVTLMEQMYLEELAKDKVYEFALFAFPLKFRGGAGSPIRAVAFPIIRSE